MTSASSKKLKAFGEYLRVRVDSVRGWPYDSRSLFSKTTNFEGLKAMQKAHQLVFLGKVLKRL